MSILGGREPLVCGLDIGSSKVACVILRGGQTLELIGGAQVPCHGLKKGHLSDIAETVRSIEEAVKAAEALCDERVGTLVVSIKGMHVNSRNLDAHVKITRSDREITHEDLAAAVEQAQGLVPDGTNDEILHAIPWKFVVDGQDIRNPIGIEGSQLKVKVHLFTAGKSAINNMVKSVQQAGFKVQDVVPAVLATAEAVVTQEEKDIGSVLIDFGAQTTDIAVFVDGGILYTHELPGGCDMITKDISQGLHASMSTAEEVKRTYGAALSKFVDADTKFNYPRVGGRSTSEMSQKDLCKFILPQTEILLREVLQALEQSGLKEQVSFGGAILTGGGTLLRGMTEAAEQVLKMQCRMGTALDVHGLTEMAGDPSYATVIGLARFGLNDTYGRAHRFAGDDGSMFSGIRGLLSRFLQ